mgnify:CR=1 FL=1
MKLYKTTVSPGDKTTVSWQGTQADAASVRKRAMDDGAKRKDVTTEDVEVPTDKAGLLAWLNANCTGE